MVCVGFPTLSAIFPEDMEALVLIGMGVFDNGIIW